MRKTEGQLVACSCGERRDPECEASLHLTVGSKLQMQLLFAHINHHVMINVYNASALEVGTDAELNCRMARNWHYDDVCELEVALDKHYFLASDWSELELSEMFQEL
jgi:hypothetical protein